MARRSRNLTFEGQYSASVLGTFRVIRGFASLKDLAEISVPYLMEDSPGSLEVKGQQRALDPDHADNIKRYLEMGERQFLPEVILSVRTDLADELDLSQPIGVVSSGTDGIEIGRAWKSRNIRVHRMKIARRRLPEIRQKKLVRRVDGNHRLARAESLQDDPSVPTKYLTSFCLLLLNPPGEAADDYSESLIFHTINSTALPLESEHALKLILGQAPEYDMTPEREFALSPDLHFTRLLRAGLSALPEPAQTRIGSQPLTSLHSAARGLLELDPDIAKDLTQLEQYAADLLAALNDIVTRIEPVQPSLAGAEYFVELAARAWKASPEGESHSARVTATVAYLDQLADWLGKDGLVDLSQSRSLSKQVIDIFDTVRARTPKRVFLARWYPEAADGEELEKADLRLDQVRELLRQLQDDDGIALELIDMGTQTGGTFPIHEKMYEAIASSDIILVDLSGVRPNVCIEAGYALKHHEKNRLIFMFQPTAAYASPPFDLKTFRYESFTDTGSIPGKVKPHVVSILQDAAAGS